MLRDYLLPFPDFFPLTMNPAFTGLAPPTLQVPFPVPMPFPALYPAPVTGVLPPSLDALGQPYSHQYGPMLTYIMPPALLARAISAQGGLARPPPPFQHAAADYPPGWEAHGQPYAAAAPHLTASAIKARAQASAALASARGAAGLRDGELPLGRFRLPGLEQILADSSEFEFDGGRSINGSDGGGGSEALSDMVCAAAAGRNVVGHAHPVDDDSLRDMAGTSFSRQQSAADRQGLAESLREVSLAAMLAPSASARFPGTGGSFRLPSHQGLRPIASGGSSSSSGDGSSGVMFPAAPASDANTATAGMAAWGGSDGGAGAPPRSGGGSISGERSLASSLGSVTQQVGGMSSTSSSSVGSQTAPVRSVSSQSQDPRDEEVRESGASLPGAVDLPPPPADQQVPSGSATVSGTPLPSSPLPEPQILIQQQSSSGSSSRGSIDQVREATEGALVPADPGSTAPAAGEEADPQWSYEQFDGTADGRQDGTPGQPSGRTSWRDLMPHPASARPGGPRLPSPAAARQPLELSSGGRDVAAVGRVPSPAFLSDDYRDVTAQPAFFADVYVEADTVTSEAPKFSGAPLTASPGQANARVAPSLLCHPPPGTEPLIGLWSIPPVHTCFLTQSVIPGGVIP